MRTKLTMLVVALALLATSCFRAHTRIAVNDDGSGQIESSIALDIDAALELANAFATEGTPEMTAEEACADFRDQQDVPEGATVEPFEEDGFCGVRYTAPFDADQLDQALAEQGTEGDFTLRREGDGWYFESVFSESVGGEELGDPLLTEDLLQGAEATIGVLLPGRQVEHNATHIDDDGTLVWELDLTAENQRIFARTEPGETILGSGSSDDDGGSGVLGVVVIVVLLAAVGGVVWLIVRRRNQAGGAQPPPGPGSPDGVGEAPPAGQPGPAGSVLPPPPGSLPPPPGAPPRPPPVA